MEVSGQFHAAAALPLGKKAPVSIGQEAWWESELVCTLWRDKSCIAGEQTQANQPIAIPTHKIPMFKGDYMEIDIILYLLYIAVTCIYF
jgi:hypothetical protein